MITEEGKAQAVKSGIAIAGAAGSHALQAAGNLTWGDIAAIATFAYVLLQAFFLLRDKWWRDPKRRWFRRRGA